MKFFDLHCDTITECYARKENLKNNSLNINLEKGKNLEKWTQVFAIFIHDDYRGFAAENYYRSVLGKFNSEIKSNKDEILHIKNRDDFLNCDKNGAVLSVEGGSALNGKIENLYKLYDDGVRLITLTWNGSNELANGCFSDDKSGLTDFGREVVKIMNEKNMAVDVSHLNEKGFYDVSEISTEPFVASHSDCVKVNDHVRSLTDEQIKIIIDRKGIIGVNFYDKFLGKQYECFDAVYRHIYHILSLGGEDAVAMGSDFDGCSIDERLNGLDKIEDLYEYLDKRLNDRKILDKICFENAHNYFTKYVFTK